MKNEYLYSKIFEKVEIDNKVWIDSDFYERFFMKDSIQLRKPLTSTALKVGAYLLTILNTKEYKRLPKRKEISVATMVSTKSVIDALNLLVAAKFLIRRDYSHNEKEIYDDAELSKDVHIESCKNTPKYFDDFKINPFYNVVLNEKTKVFFTAREPNDMLSYIIENDDLKKLVNYCIDNEEFISVAKQMALKHHVEKRI